LYQISDKYYVLEQKLFSQNYLLLHNAIYKWHNAIFKLFAVEWCRNFLDNGL